jgi:hypothetical protein
MMFMQERSVKGNERLPIVRSPFGVGIRFSLLVGLVLGFEICCGLMLCDWK